MVHSVQFYDTHDALIDRLAGIVCSGLLIGNSILIIANEQHRNQLLRTLDRLELNVRKSAHKRRFSMCDCKETLSLFMRNDMPDAELFRATVGQWVIESESKDRGLTVFGEMVAALWAEGNKAGAIALERCWHDTLKENAFHLHCAYPRSLFLENESDSLNICEVHLHILNPTVAEAWLKVG